MECWCSRSCRAFLSPFARGPGADQVGDADLGSESRTTGSLETSRWKMSTSPFRRNNLARPLLPSCLPDSHLLRYLPYVLDTPCIRSYLRISITPSLSRSLSIATLFSASNRPHLSQLTKQSQAESASQRESGSALHQLIRSVLAANPPPRRLNLGHGVAPPLVPEPLRMIRVRS